MGALHKTWGSFLITGILIGITTILPTGSSCINTSSGSSSAIEVPLSGDTSESDWVSDKSNTSNKSINKKKRKAIKTSVNIFASDIQSQSKPLAVIETKQNVDSETHNDGDDDDDDGDDDDDDDTFNYAEELTKSNNKQQYPHHPIKMKVVKVKGDDIDNSGSG